MKSINEWAKEIHENAVAHGWHDTNRAFPEVVALCHSELSEALEEYRNGKPMFYTECGACGMCANERDGMCTLYKCIYDDDEDDPRKAEGIAVEMIDCLIRILDWCGKEGIDVETVLSKKHEYNKTRPYRHGGKVC